MKKFGCLVIISFLSLAIIGQEVESFETFKKNVRSHWAKGERVKSIELLNDKLDVYRKPAEQHTIIYYLGLLYLETDNFTKSSAVFKKGFERDFFFSFGKNYSDKIEKEPDGKILLQNNEENRSKYLENSKTKIKVLLPPNYSRERKYPLLYFFHGNNSNLNFLEEEWINVKLSTDTIVVLAQARYPRSNFAFDWIENEDSHKSVQEIHEEVGGKYSIDTSKILVGGFSNGGRMAIRIFLDQTIPTRGFLVFNPSKPKTFQLLQTNIKGKGAIITGEKDYILAKQISMANDFFASSFPLRLIVFPKHGHDYPNEFSNELNESIHFLLGK